MKVGIEFTSTRPRNERYPIFIYQGSQEQIIYMAVCQGDFVSVANGVFVCIFAWRSTGNCARIFAVAVHTYIQMTHAKTAGVAFQALSRRVSTTGLTATKALARFIIRPHTQAREYMPPQLQVWLTIQAVLRFKLFQIGSRSIPLITEVSYSLARRAGTSLNYTTR